MQSADDIVQERGESIGGIATTGNYSGNPTADELRSTEGIS